MRYDFKPYTLFMLLQSNVIYKALSNYKYFSSKSEVALELTMQQRCFTATNFKPYLMLLWKQKWTKPYTFCFLQVTRTIISQGHLSPFTLNTLTVHWDFDYCLRLYPLPDLIVIGDKFEAYHGNYKGCEVVNPVRKDCIFNIFTLTVISDILLRGSFRF